MGLAVPLQEGRLACAESVEAFSAAAAGFGEYDLLGASRCHGWTRLDVVVHVLFGWQEMLGGFVSPVDSAPTVDAATYWPTFASEYATDDALIPLLAQRRRTAAYSRPASALEHLGAVGEAIRRGVASCQDQRYLWQGQVFEAGDFLAIWAVENVVHHLDLLSDTLPPPSGLALCRASVEALAGDLPAEWSDTEVTLVGTGRVPVPAGAGDAAARLPAFG